MRRLPTFVITWLVSVPRCISKYSSPCHTGTGAPVAASASTASKNPSTVPSSSRGRPSRSAIRRARSTISRVGPPPPLPWPYGVSDQSLQPCSWKLRTRSVCSAGTIVALYVSTGGKCVSTRLPSMPSHQKVLWGNRFSLFHDSFCVTKRSQPPAAKICGSEAG